MHSHEDLLTAFLLSADLLLRSRLYALAERKVLRKRNTIGGAVNRRSTKNAFSEAASIFVLRQLLRDYQGRAALDSCLPRFESSGRFSGTLLCVQKSTYPAEKNFIKAI